MRRFTSDPAGADRARWLAELASAIDDAQRVAWQIGVEEGNNAEARSLYARLEAARLEVEALRRGRWSREPADVCPDWMRSLLAASNLLPRQD